MTVVILTSGSSWTVPDDWNSSNNTIEAIGGGGSVGTNSGGAAAGGAYAKISNFSSSAGTSINIQIGLGGGTTGAGTTPTSNTWFKDGSTLVAEGGASVGASSNVGATGSSANSVGSVKNAGGNGGSSVAGFDGGGGGGAGGPNGVGLNGAAGTATPTGGAGGNGDNGSGGAGGAGSANGPGHNGSPGTEWGTAGSGGGGGAPSGSTNTVAGNGGLYGGGGSGAATNNPGGTGANGVIVIAYQPSYNLPKVHYLDLHDRRIVDNAKASAARLAQIWNDVYPLQAFRPMAFYQPLSEPTRRKSDHAQQPFVPGVGWLEIGLPPLPRFTTWFRPLDEPIRRKSDHAGQPIGRFPGVEAPYVYVPHPLPPPEPSVFDFPIPYFTTDIPSEHITDAVNFLIDEVNAVLVGQGMTCGDSGSALVHDVVTALNNAGQWQTVWNYMQADRVVEDFDVLFAAAFTTRINDAFYNMIRTVTGYSTAQMLALWKTANS